jgi:hypothetical protein
MERVVLGDPAWFDTFPCRVDPRPGEAFMSLLLRCDEENGWVSGTTYAHVRGWRYSPRNLPDLVVPSQQVVDALAEFFCLPKSTVAATAYLSELKGLFGTVTPLPGDLCSWFVFRLCPVCVKEYRVILRCNFLTGMTSCLQHQLSLLSSCTCGTALKPFNSKKAPFICSVCEKDWGELPRVPAVSKDLEKEQQILACYEWWLGYGVYASLERTFYQLLDLEVYALSENRPRNSSRWLSVSPRARSYLRKSRNMGPLSALVNDLDRWNMLHHFAKTT